MVLRLTKIEPAGQFAHAEQVKAAFDDSGMKRRSVRQAPADRPPAAGWQRDQSACEVAGGRRARAVRREEAIPISDRRPIQIRLPRPLHRPGAFLPADAFPFVSIAAPPTGCSLKSKAMENFFSTVRRTCSACGHDFRANAIAGQHGNLVCVAHVRAAVVGALVASAQRNREALGTSASTSFRLLLAGAYLTSGASISLRLSRTARTKSLIRRRSLRPGLLSTPLATSTA